MKEGEEKLTFVASSNGDGKPQEERIDLLNNYKYNFELDTNPALENKKKSGGCCQLNPRRGCAYLITSVILNLFLAVAVVYLVFFSGPSGSLHKKRSEKLIGCSNDNSNDINSNDSSLLPSLVTRGKVMTKELMAVFDDESIWKLYKNYSKLEASYIHKDGDQYRVNGWFPRSPKELIKIFFDQYEETHKWHPTAGTTIIIEQVLEKTQIGYQKTLQYGPISPRDFFLLRHYEDLPNGGIILSFESIEWNEDRIEKPTNAVRGEYGLSGWRFRAIPGKENESTAEFIFNADFNIGWIPFWDSFAIKGLQETFVNLRKHLAGNETQIE